MRRVLAAHAKVLTWALNRPIGLGLVCLALVVGTYFGYNAARFGPAARDG